MIYVYAVVDPSTARKVAAGGLCDEPVRYISRNGVAAVYSRHCVDGVAATKENLLRHEQVAEALMDLGDLLPARFGTSFSTEAELCDVLERRADALRSGLDRVRQCVELGLRVLWRPEEEAGDAGAERTAGRSGREYMLARLENERRRRRREEQAQRLVEAIQAPLTPLVRECSRRVLATPALLLTAAYLIDRDRIGSFRLHVRNLSAGYPELNLLCTGPWPPYSFTPDLPTPEERHV